jgi:hypothetical protein
MGHIGVGVGADGSFDGGDDIGSQTAVHQHKSKGSDRLLQRKTCYDLSNCELWLYYISTHWQFMHMVLRCTSSSLLSCCT